MKNHDMRKRRRGRPKKKHVVRTYKMDRHIAKRLAATSKMSGSSQTKIVELSLDITCLRN